jgi:hypothetical protein
MGEYMTREPGSIEHPSRELGGEYAPKSDKKVNGISVVVDRDLVNKVTKMLVDDIGKRVVDFEASTNHRFRITGQELDRYRRAYLAEFVKELKVATAPSEELKRDLDKSSKRSLKDRATERTKSD